MRIDTNPPISPELVNLIQATVRAAVAEAVTQLAAPAPAKYLTSKQVMERLNISQASLFSFISSGKLTAKKVGVRNRFAVHEVDALVTAGAPQRELTGGAAANQDAKRRRARAA